MKQYIILFLILVTCNQTFAQQDGFPCEVNVPYNIGIKELLTYGADSDTISRGDSCRTYNILYPERKSLEDGVYRFFVSGKEILPTRLFICHNSKIYFFKNTDRSSPNGVLSEYSDYIDKLDLSDSDVIKYLKAVWIYLKDERKMNDCDVKDTSEVVKGWLNNPIEKDTAVHECVNLSPVFPGGKKGLYSYIEKAIKSSKLLGRISRKANFYVTYIIECDGTVSNVEVLSSFNSKYNPEIIRIISHMPKWKPEKEDGVPVRVLFDLVRMSFNQLYFYFHGVVIPDSIGIKEVLVYDPDATVSKGDGYPTFNILYPNKYSFGNGLYLFSIPISFHIPDRIFIYYNSRVYFFNNEGFLSPSGVVREYSECIDNLQISDDDAVNYLKGIWLHLKDESKKDYGIYAKETANPQENQIEKDTMVYDIADQMPVFPGGNNELRAYLDKAVKSSMLFKEKSPETNSYVSFIIERDGTVSNVKVIHSFDPREDPELLRIVSEMPKWIPGENKGRTVRISYNLAM